MDVKKTFLILTSRTYPFGCENELEFLLPQGYFKDQHGNYYFEIPGSKTVFTCHLDTACKEQKLVKHRFDGNIIKTDGTSILGADDKAGMTVILSLIENNVKGLYCFFVGEEVGCVGSKLASKNEKFFSNYDRIISFDRRGTSSVITHQSSKRCCSDEFAKSLAQILNSNGMEMSPDDTGVYTDSAEFVGVIPECTNISVGYYKEHTVNEHQDIEHLEKLCEAVSKVDWESLPTKRDPKIIEYKEYQENLTQKVRKSWKTDYQNHTDINDYVSRTSQYKGSENDWKYAEWNSQTEVYRSSKKYKKKSKVYFGSVGLEITDDYRPKKSEKKSYYEHVKQYLINDRITKKEFEKIKEQYLDLNDPEDFDFYLEMRDDL